MKSRIRLVAHVARMGEMRYACSIFVEKSERRRPLGKHSHRWEDNIIINFRKIVWEIVDWIHLIQDRDKWRAPVNIILNLRVP
jgi:hypothetical protein